MAKRKNMAAEADASEVCTQWLPKKGRQCKFPRVRGSLFCGNHVLENTPTGGKRIPCPFDPNHTVLESEVEAHLKKCPKVQQARARSEQPYFRPACNYGSGDELDLAEPEAGRDGGPSPAEQPSPSPAAAAAAVAATAGAAAAAGSLDEAPPGGERRGGAATGTMGPAAAALAWRPPPTSAQRATYAARIGEQRLRQLVGRIQAAHAQACSDMPGAVQELMPAGCELRSDDRLRPFSLKHARQQASIVGHMQLAGLAPAAAPSPDGQQQPGGAWVTQAGAGSAGDPAQPAASSAAAAAATEQGGLDPTETAAAAAAAPEESGIDQTVYVEFGAGTGYLSAYLAESTGAQRLILLDRGSFRNKADRHLRDRNMQRLRCDIGDFEPAGVAALEDPAGRWVALGKHLCGGATDLTLRCCVRAEAAKAEGGTGTVWAALAGIAVATCCHHRCSWRQYVNKAFFRDLGLTAHDFELMVWMTGWALCGHEAPTEEPADVDTSRPDAGQPVAAVDAPLGDPAGASGPSATAGTGAGAGSAAPAGAGAGGQELQHAGKSLSRQERIGVGQKCKQLMDQGRLLWLRQHGFQASIALYVPSDVSGENRLLLATTGSPPVAV